jgi:Skp family chaperone for outer membrane proteins
MNRVVKTTLLVAGVMVAQTLLFAFPATAQLKIGFVRPDFVLGQYEPYKNALKQVDDYEKAETDKLRQMADDFQKKVEAAQKQAQLMKDDQIAAKRAELEKEQANIQKRQEDVFNRQDGLLVKKHAELVQPVFDQFNSVLEKIGQADKYDYIFNAETDTQVILYADKKYDISEQVAAELKKMPAPVAKAPAQAAPKASAPSAPKAPASKAPAKK